MLPALLWKNNVSANGKLLPGVVHSSTGNKPEDDFAVLIDNIPKILYPRALQSVVLKNTFLKHEVDKAALITGGAI
jgi:hypothetical protein